MNKTQVYSSLLVFVILFGLCITILGLTEMENIVNMSLLRKFEYHYLGYCALVVLIIEVFSRRSQTGRLHIAVAIVALISIATGNLWPLFTGIWIALSSYALGGLTIRALKIDASKVPGVSILLIGVGIFGTLVGLSAHFPINYPGFYGVILILPVVISWQLLVKELGRFYKLRVQSTELSWLDLLIGLIALVHFTVALMPEVGADALAMHLFIPAHLSFNHEWGFDVTKYVWAVMPMMGDWVYSLGYMLGGETAARIMNVGFIYILAWLIRDLVIWAGGNELGARWAILLFLTTPLTYTESSSLFVESIWASFLVAGSLSILQLISSNNAQKLHMAAAGILLGCALATKAVTFMVLPALLVLLVVYHRHWLSIKYVNGLLLGLTFFLAIGVIPYVTAWSFTGNPVFPFFNEFFQAPQYLIKNFSPSAIFEKGVAYDTLYRITFESSKYLEGRPGSAGFQWLLLLVPAIVLLTITLNRKGILLVTLGLLAVVFTFHQTAYLRYIFPSFVVLSAAIGIALSSLLIGKKLILRRLVLIASVLAVSLNVMFFQSGTYYGAIALKPLLSDSGRYQYLQHRLPIRNAVDFVNKVNTNQSPVAVLAPPLMAGLSSDAVYSSWYNHKFQSLFQKARSADVFADLLLNKGVNYLILDENRVDTEKRLIIKEATEELAGFGPISVRTLRDKYKFITELLSDTDVSAPDSWNLSLGVKKTPEGIIVRKGVSATQVVSVTAGRSYLLAINTSCLVNPSKGRMQVNWLSESAFISADIRSFDCSKEPTWNTLELVAPLGATKGVIYATAHTVEPLIIYKLSFRK